MNKQRTIWMMLSAAVFIGSFFLTGMVQAAEASITLGSKGDQVISIQQALQDKGYSPGSIDGIYGEKTKNAVMRLQKDFGLTTDGIVGANTKAVLFNTISNKTGQRTITVVATAYCPCYQCNYPYYGQPSYIGLPLAKGIVAVDPKLIPMGSKLYIPGYGEGIAADQGNAIKGNRIDLFFPTHQQALNWGMKTITITVFDS